MQFPMTQLTFTPIGKILAFFNVVSKLSTHSSDPSLLLRNILRNLFRKMSKIVVRLESLSSNIRKFFPTFFPHRYVPKLLVGCP